MQESDLKKTEVLKNLKRFEGTEGHLDYFTMFQKGKLKYGLKVDFARNILGMPTGFFARIRVVASDEVDIYNIEQHFAGALESKGKINKILHSDQVKAEALKVDPGRLSFVIISEKNLNDYGDPTTMKGWEDLCEALEADMAAMGGRIFNALTAFEKLNESVRQDILKMMKDYCHAYQPPKPQGKAVTKKGKPGKDNVVPMKKAAEEILSEVTGKPTTIEFKDDDGK